MLLLSILILTEILTPVILRQHFFTVSKVKYYFSIIVHFILSLWLWILFLETYGSRSFFDTPRHIWMMLNFNGMLCAVLFPRVILNLCHFSGKLARIKSGDHLRWLTNAGMAVMVTIFSLSAFATLYGRFNFKTEEVGIKINGLNKDLDGLKIVQISDLHLACFYHHPKLLQELMERVTSYKPDLILNTGDFVTYGWREFDRNDTILSKAHSRYGNYAVLGNHDYGTYHPFFTEADRLNNVLILNKKIESSGYKVLNDEYTKVSIGDAKIGMIGIITMGSHRHIEHGDLGKAISGLDSVDLKILLSHDPNQWALDTEGKTDIDITLSGHTHGMQLGIITKKFRWSPAKYFYPHWNGLFSEGKQFHYVNRGLGILGIPFRLWMPPEITIITLKRE